jgi:hypothetical protein
MPKVSKSPESGLGSAFKPEVIAEPSKQNAEPASAESLRKESAPKGLSKDELAQAVQAKPRVTIRDATERWVEGWNEIPHSLLKRMLEHEGPDSLQEITPFHKGQCVYVHG